MWGDGIKKRFRVKPGMTTVSNKAPSINWGWLRENPHAGESILGFSGFGRYCEQQSPGINQGRLRELWLTVEAAKH